MKTKVISFFMGLLFRYLKKTMEVESRFFSSR